MRFALLLDSWLRGPLRDWAEDLLDAKGLARVAFLRSAPIHELWGRYLSGQVNGQYLLWDVLMFEASLNEQVKAE